MFCVRCGRRDLAHGKKCMYCKTRLVYPADLRFLNERDERQRGRRLLDDRNEREERIAEQNLPGLSREERKSKAEKARRDSEWRHEAARPATNDRLCVNASAETLAEKISSDRPRKDAEGDSSKEKLQSDRLRKSAKEASFSAKASSDWQRGSAGEDAAPKKRASDRSREGIKEAASSGKSHSDSKRESTKVGTSGGWSLFDRAREEAKTVARPGFVEKAEAFAGADAEERGAQSERRRAAEKNDRPERRCAAEEAGRSERRRSEEKNDQPDRCRTSGKTEKANQRRSAEKLHGSSNPVVRLPAKQVGNGIVRPAVRLPEKRSARPGAQTQKKAARSNRAGYWKNAGEETLKKAQRLTRSAKKAFKSFENALERRTRKEKDRENERTRPLGSSSKPTRATTAKRRGSMPSRRTSGQPRRIPPRGTRNARSHVRLGQGRETFLERHLRSIIAMALLVVTVVMICVWSTSTVSGKRTFAQLGIGSASGYILLGDDCMEAGNYARAVEHYYLALSRHTTYESAIRLARAYRMTGDTEREASVLLLCADQFETEREPYERLRALYPTLTQRPESVQNALNRGAHVLGDASIAQ